MPWLGLQHVKVVKHTHIAKGILNISIRSEISDENVNDIFLVGLFNAKICCAIVTAMCLLITSIKTIMTYFALLS